MVLKLDSVSKSYLQGGSKFTVVSDVSMLISAGEVVSLVGSSGCGKSTLLHIMGLLDSPDCGHVYINNKLCDAKDDTSADLVRAKDIGFVYQFHHLIPEFSVVENVMLPLIISGINHSDAKTKSAETLMRLSLKHVANHMPSQLSGGQQQRVAIARAMVHKPRLILADEPTGNLDPYNSEIVFAEFIKLAKEDNAAVVIVTHNLELAKKTDNIYTIKEASLSRLDVQ